MIIIKKVASKLASSAYAIRDQPNADGNCGNQIQLESFHCNKITAAKEEDVGKIAEGLSVSRIALKFSNTSKI
jgi:hypothetical protein